MEKTASQIQKERIKELEAKADALIAKCDVATLTSVNEKGYPPHLRVVHLQGGWVFRYLLRNLKAFCH